MSLAEYLQQRTPDYLGAFPMIGLELIIITCLVCLGSEPNLTLIRFYAPFGNLCMKYTITISLYVLKTVLLEGGIKKEANSLFSLPICLAKRVVKVHYDCDFFTSTCLDKRVK